MSDGDEEIIKQRLLIDGDGTGDDRRLNTLLKQFLKWCSSKNDTPESNHIIFDRLLSQMALCEIDVAKTDFTCQMIDEELENYAKLSEQIEKSIELAKNEIDECKKELVLAKQIRKNKMEYDMLAKVIKEQPDRKETTTQIETLKKELQELVQKKVKLERKFQKRRNDFRLLMYSVHELEAQLNSSSESEQSDAGDVGVVADVTGCNDNDISMDLGEDEVPTTSKAAASAVAIEKEPIEENAANTSLPAVADEDDSGKTTMSVDEETVLELSIDKDEHMSVKLDDSLTIVTT